MKNLKSLFFCSLVPLMLAGCSDTTVPDATLPTRAVYDLSSPDITRGTIIVDFKDDTSESDIKQIGDLVGVSFSERNPTAQKFKIDEAFVDELRESAILSALQNDPHVESAEPLIKFEASFVPNDPMYKDQWHMKRVGAEKSWGMSCGMGATVAVVDTGVACFDAEGFKRLSDLAGTKCEGGYDFINDKEMAADDQSHGSHVAGTIAQTTNNELGTTGLAPCATIMPVKVLGGDGSGSNESVAEGIRFAADHGAQVINLSLGGSMPSSVVESAVNYAYHKGVTVVAAAGNSSGRVGYPAAYKNVIAVSASDQRDNLASFSCRGPEIAIAGPGVDVMQQTLCRDGNPLCHTFASYSGTSMATPHVAGEAALIVSSGITNPDDVKRMIQSTADPKDNKNYFGAGIMRADKAVSGTIWSHFLVRVLGLIGVLFLLRKVISFDMVKSKLSVLGVVVSGFGLFPLFFTGLFNRMGSFRFLGELLARPIGEWHMVFGFATQYMPLLAAVPATLLSLLLLGSSTGKKFAGGFALGTAALCFQTLYSADVFFFLGSLALRICMFVSMGVCLYFVRNIFDKKQ